MSSISDRIFYALPYRIQKIIGALFINSITKKQRESLPVIHLAQENVQNCRLVCNRNELLKQLPPNAVVAEVGVYMGDYAEEILKSSTPSHLYLIDSWQGPIFGPLKSQVEERFAKEIKDKKVTLLQQDSLEALKSFDDEFFDWIYLDSDHSYKHTKLELELVCKKIKKGGLICGHDYTKGVWEAWWFRFGVIEAVNEFCVNHGYEFAYLTLDKGGFFSYGIRKIQE